MDQLLSAARAAREHAWAPYSGYRVGAALRGGNGEIYTGCNVENAAYPEGICAEAAAVAAMVSAGEARIAEVLVIAGGPRPCTPCGGCRQKLSEFATAEVPVHIADETGVVGTYLLGDLLPHAFGPDHLKPR